MASNIGPWQNPKAGPGPSTPNASKNPKVAARSMKQAQAQRLLKLAASLPPASSPGFITNAALGQRPGTGRYSVRRQEEWLRRSAMWPHLRDDEWRAHAVLGAGGYGLVGLWKYIGKDPYMPPDVVVKQSASLKSLQLESNFLSHIQAACDTDHIIKLYKPFFRDGGTGTSTADPLPHKTVDGVAGAYDTTREIGRIFLEYCSGGDIQDRMSGKRDYHPTEEHIWRLFDCMAKALCVLEHGTEDPTSASWEKPIIHFDLKPANVFIGSHDKSHNRVEPFKLADFGLSSFAPTDAMTKKGSIWRDYTHWRGTAGYLSPEQIYNAYHEEGDNIGSPVNAWALGVCIAVMMLGNKRGFRNVQGREHLPAGGKKILMKWFTTSTPSISQTGAAPYSTAARALIDPGVPYSKHLIDLVHACLAYLPHIRPNAREILAYTTTAIEGLDQFNKENNVTGASNFAETSQPANTPLNNTKARPELAHDIVQVRTRGQCFPKWVPRRDWDPLYKFNYIKGEDGAPLVYDLWPWENLPDSPPLPPARSTSVVAQQLAGPVMQLPAMAAQAVLAPAPIGSAPKLQLDPVLAGMFLGKPEAPASGPIRPAPKLVLDPMLAGMFLGKSENDADIPTMTPI